MGTCSLKLTVITAGVSLILFSIAFTPAHAAVTVNGSPAPDPYTLSSGSVGSVVATASSEVNITGGTADDVTMNNSSQFTATSGGVNFQTVLNNSAVGNITGGTFGSIATNDNAVLSFGGSASVNNDMAAQGSGVVNISGGNLFFFVFANGSATMNFSGGNMTNQVFYNDSSTGSITGGSFSDTLTAQGGTVTVAGSGFTLDGSPVSGTLTDTNGSFFGTLQNGGAIDVFLDVFDGGSVILVPEPSAGMLALLGVAITAVRSRRRRG